MRFSSIALLGALSSVALSQGLTGSLPECAQNCFGNSLGDCDQNDFRCICGNTELISSLSCCVSQTCSPEEQSAIIGLAAGLCGGVGVQVPTSASCASTASATPAPSGSSNGTASLSGSSTPTASGATAQGSGAGPASTGAAPLHTAGVMGVAMAGLLMAL
ncbi:hypothetical protein BS50DRAFT_639961 [Corynespora cassiicola Philippines]|uniref:CFEM domain-containing protein n=1 Tax=Corynespora cassiicola Philippines TaxID=1448308 RepID=A0A2T2N524_CORCC|nr:hypothetical protein BS50DRAFT_639961 [Corynespora cassiicola Philippines]